MSSYKNVTRGNPKISYEDKTLDGLFTYGYDRGKWPFALEK